MRPHAIPGAGASCHQLLQPLLLLVACRVSIPLGLRALQQDGRGTRVALSNSTMQRLFDGSITQITNLLTCQLTELKAQLGKPCSVVGAHLCWAHSSNVVCRFSILPACLRR